MKYFNEELMTHIMQEAGDLIHFFGYAKREENPTGVFEFKEPKQSDVDQHYGF